MHLRPRSPDPAQPIGEAAPARRTKRNETLGAPQPSQPLLRPCPPLRLAPPRRPAGGRAHGLRIRPAGRGRASAAAPSPKRPHLCWSARLRVGGHSRHQRMTLRSLRACSITRGVVGRISGAGQPPSRCCREAGMSGREVLAEQALDRYVESVSLQQGHVGVEASSGKCLEKCKLPKVE